MPDQGELSGRGWQVHTVAMVLRDERRRKRPPTKDGPRERRDEPAGVPWPAGGFDASPFSPAGEVQGLSRLADGLARSPLRRRWARRAAVGVASMILAVCFVALLIGALTGRG